MTASIERFRTARQALAYRAHHLAGNEVLQQLLLEPLLEGRRVDFDAGKSLH